MNKYNIGQDLFYVSFYDGPRVCQFKVYYIAKNYEEVEYGDQNEDYVPSSCVYDCPKKAIDEAINKLEKLKSGL